ncbi:MAG: biopolymer transporter ExbD [Verrucomicrobia bacterium]|nr:biopolymer transporter ExbD [Verrucomicrobiota bacterium]
MKKTTRSHHGTLNELNITPLLDLVFVLLVIFIITTPQLMNNLEMTLPSSQVPPVVPDAPKPEINRIQVDRKGVIRLNQTVVTLVELKSRLEARKRAATDLAVVVKGSDETDYQNMISILDVLQQLEITKIGLATD